MKPTSRSDDNVVIYLWGVLTGALVFLLLAYLNGGITCAS